jgi:hypothetical protein
MVTWLDRATARSLIRPPQHGVQGIVLPADLAQLRRDIPLPPEPDGPEPYASRWWCGVIGQRWIEVEWSEIQDSVTIHTPFEAASEPMSDWPVLRELEALPPSIRIRDPSFIQSRATGADAAWAVFVPDPRGWDEPIYDVHSAADARGLLAYLTDGRPAAKWKIAPAIPRGDWEVVAQHASGAATIIGCYTYRGASLALAHQKSLADPTWTFTVRLARADDTSPTEQPAFRAGRRVS